MGGAGILSWTFLFMGGILDRMILRMWNRNFSFGWLLINVILLKERRGELWTWSQSPLLPSLSPWDCELHYVHTHVQSALCAHTWPLVNFIQHCLDLSMLLSVTGIEMIEQPSQFVAIILVLQHSPNSRMYHSLNPRPTNVYHPMVNVGGCWK